MAQKRPNCPICGENDQVIPIIYGMPAPELFEKEEVGKVRLGGCIIDQDNKEWYCKRDGLEFNKRIRSERAN